MRYRAFVFWGGPPDAKGWHAAARGYDLRGFGLRVISLRGGRSYPEWRQAAMAAVAYARRLTREAQAGSTAL
jgi:hypothetical protein